MESTDIQYDRKLDDKHLIHFKEGGLLNFLIANPLIPDQKRFKGLTEFDIQFRENNNVAVYCGLTKVLNIKFNQRGGIPFRFNSKSYSKQSCFPSIEINTNPEQVIQAVHNYLNQMIIDDKWWKKEGIVQTQYISLCSRNWKISAPAAIFDKELVFSYKSEKVKTFLHNKYTEQINSIKNKLINNIGNNWKAIKETGAEEIDLMGFSAKGNELYIIEVKGNNASADQIYYSPFQLLYYIYQWNDALNNSPKIVQNINDLVNQKKVISLLPANFPKLNEVEKIIPVLAVQKKTWSDEVQNRLESTIRFINLNTNRSLLNFEIWEINNGRINRTML